MTKRMYDKFTKRAKDVLQLAIEEAKAFNHPHIGTEHFLLGLVRDYDGVAGRILADAGMKLAPTRHAVEFIVGVGEPNPHLTANMTERAKTLIEFAIDEAKRRDHNYVGTEHLLLGLLQLNEGVAHGVLDMMGVNPNALLEQMNQMLRQSANLSSSTDTPNPTEAVIERSDASGVTIRVPAQSPSPLVASSQRRRIPVAVLGATGAVGQRFLTLLHNHPWFEVVALTGSERTVGRPYGELVRWVLDDAPPPEFANMIVTPTEEVADVAIALSALPTDAAKIYEPLWAASVTVCSNASSYRMTPDVPLIIPEVNPDHLNVLERQRRERGWKGCLITNPNCSTIGIVLALKPLHDAFGLTTLQVATLQAISGAGYPGVASLDILDNIVPNIADGGEEVKIETEPLKLLGTVAAERFVNAPINISAQVSRVPVIDGHTALLSAAFARQPSVEEALAALEGFQAPEVVRGLPSAPAKTIIVRYEIDRPQPRRDRNLGGGMSAVVGRVRTCPINHLRLVALAHNTIRGAAGGALLNAELLVAAGVVG